MAEEDKTKLSEKQIADHVNEVAVWEPIDIGDPDPPWGYVDDLPPGEQRTQADQLLEELRARRERETTK